ncbi:MAG: hypothetical protein GY851_36655 [bacterium]|nr:hypothetical protein [bacterium]
MSKIIKPREPTESGYPRFERSLLEEWIPDSDSSPGESRRAAPEPPDVAAARILSEARAQAEQKIREAYDEGMRRGEEAGRTQFQESVEGAAESLRETAAALIQARSEFLEALELDLVLLAQAAAERIVRREIRTDPDLVRTTVRAALDNLLDREHVTVRLNPKDLETLREQEVSLLEGFDGVKRLDVVADESVEPGGCLLDTETVHVDARVDAQLQRIFDSMLE